MKKTGRAYTHKNSWMWNDLCRNVEWECHQYWKTITCYANWHPPRLRAARFRRGFPLVGNDWSRSAKVPASSGGSAAPSLRQARTGSVLRSNLTHRCSRHSLQYPHATQTNVGLRSTVFLGGMTHSRRIFGCRPDCSSASPRHPLILGLAAHSDPALDPVWPG